ncbi:hypothetical protein JYG23_14675 [Sedimentibacter sp. zth1]|uniref:hypothetical protein n=1 Tax=Sedimentibacter sp. zth1 TaxID=2816908 RepID=UPI001A92C615|nr:hypothetical protein [Sedimentibacter sp. zth1]QSX05886.1 hypothetical protein JYG23_14675 [Sedimentibacter sp. zth1]
MKKSLRFLIIFILITLLIMSYVKTNLDLNLVEVHFDIPQSPEKVNNLIESMYAYDFVNVYDILINNQKMKVCDGNINILLEQYKFKDLKLNYSDNEVLVGKKYIEHKSLYSVPPKTLTICSNTYDINGVLLDTEDIIYRDLNLLNDNPITEQTLYIEKSSIDGYVDIDRIQTVLGYKYINTTKLYDYNNLYKTLIIILFFLISITFIILIIILIKWLNSKIKMFKNGYREQKQSIYFSQYIKQKNNVSNLLKIILCVVVTAILVLCCGYFINYIFTTKVLLNINITSIKNITNLVDIFKEFSRLNFKYGFSYYEVMVFKIVIVYLAMCLITVVSIIKSLCILIYKSVFVKQ